jgi:very-short-patch-repair endonuclease
MRQPLYDKKALKERGLLTNGFCLPYNPKLIARAIELRKNMTPMERKLWIRLFKNFPLKVARQKVIDNYIVDFYCAKLGLVVEVDGNVHDTYEAKEYDEERTKILENYNLKVIRFRNEEVEIEFDKVCAAVMDELRKKTGVKA